MITDTQRVDIMVRLIEMGYADRILLSHDVSFKTRLSGYGGSGYAHILLSIVPEMRRKGIPEELISQILITNPTRALTFQ